jgi:DNA polymerase-1
MIVIVDGHSIAYRAFYKTPPLNNSKGFPTGVIHTFLNIIIKLQQTLKPNLLIVAFDSKGETERHKKLKEYKAERLPSPEDIILQVEELKNILPLMGVVVYAIEGYEADDIIYTLTQKVAKCEKIVIVTRDKDIHQIVNEDISIYDDSKQEFIDREGVYKKFGVYPEQIPDYLALTGDSSDNIPGVKGIGPKNATLLLQQYGNLDNIYAHLNDLSPSVRTKLEEGKEMAYLSRELTKLCIIDDLTLKEANANEELLKDKLRDLELHGIYNRIFKKSSDEKSSTDMKKGSLNYENLYDIIIYIDGDIYKLKGGTYRKVDTLELNGEKYFYDFKNIYKKYHIRRNNFYDLVVISWLNDPDSKGIVKSRDESVESFIMKVMERCTLEIEELYNKNLDRVYEEIEMKIIYILADMELIGVKIDVVKLKEAAEHLENIRKELEEHILDIFGYSFNLNSPKQLSEALFKKLNIKPVKKTKTGLSTSVDSLKEIAIAHSEYKELIDKILYYREVNKLLTTYTTKLIEYVDSNSRIHTEYKQTGTATGRLSSNNPNMQNIPQKGELAREIRSAFISDENCYFVSFDYSQIELRILAHLSQDRNLIEAFNKDLDIHDITARTIFNIQKDENVSPNARRIAKAVNFGIIYGLSPYGLSKEIEVSQQEARLFIEKYFQQYPGVSSYIEKVQEEAKKKGYTETISGRRRYIKDLNSRNYVVRQRAERIAINAPLQGSAADIIKLAMIKSIDYIKNKNFEANLVLQVHDELVFEVNKTGVDIFAKDIKQIMENVVALRVPLKINSGIGENLGELKG